MTDIEIKIIGKQHEKDINIKNEPFPLFGLLIPSYNNCKWDYTIKKFAPENTREMCFPDENYCYDEMTNNSVFIGAYDGKECVGLAIMQHAFFRYMYLYDLKVNAKYRGKSVGKMLIDKAKEVAKENGYIGIYTQGQDNNLGACMFYLKCGFVIGGFDSHVYGGTSQQGKADVIFYLDME